MYLYSICGCSTAVHCVGYIVIFSMLYRQWNLCSSEETKCASRRRHRLLRCTEASRHRLLRCTKVSRHRLLRCTEVSRRRLLKCTEIEFQIRNYVECLQDADCGIILCALVLFVSCHYSMCSAIDLTAFPFVRWCIVGIFLLGLFQIVIMLCHTCYQRYCIPGIAHWDMWCSLQIQCFPRIFKWCATAVHIVCVCYPGKIISFVGTVLSSVKHSSC